MVLLDISQALRKREVSGEGFVLMITVEHQSSQLEAGQDAQAEVMKSVSTDAMAALPASSFV